MLVAEAGRIGNRTARRRCSQRGLPLTAYRIVPQPWELVEHVRCQPTSGLSRMAGPYGLGAMAKA